MSFYTLNPRLRKKRQMMLSGLGLLVIMVAVFAGAWQIQVVREFFGQASGVPASLIIDTQAVLGPIPRPWRNLAQGGESHDWRIGSLTPQVAALKPEYIRIDHIYDFYEIVQGTPGNLSFEWSKLDLIIDDIIAAGAKPYIALSYMPPAISSGDILAYPVNWSDWQLVVQRTIEHVSGTRKISNVYYEVWNEPDLFGDYKYYGNKNYLTMYAYASAGAKNARGVLPFKLGGPAITALYKNWFDAWAKGCIANNWRCDFFSWHRYNTNLNQFFEDMNLVETWVTAYPQLEPTLEFHITEWGHDSENHPGYDTMYAAAHNVAAAIAMSGRVQRAFLFEIQDGKDPAGQAKWGRWGMFLHNDFGATAKPRYHAMRLLDSIPDQRLQITGNGSFVKALAGRNELQQTEVVIANFDARGRNSEVVPITFLNIEPGNYTLHKEFLGAGKQQQLVATDAAVLRVEVFMPALEVAKLKLVKNN